MDASLVALVLPDFGLIALGFALARLTRWDPRLWEGVERLTYFVLFPALLFVSNARARLDLGAAAPLILTVFAALAAGMALGMLAKALFDPRREAFGAGFQCAFRFNSYIGLALAGRLYGEPGLALMALVIGAAVPVVNVAAVWALARGGERSMAREIATNPLLLASAAGVAWGALGLPLPAVADSMLSRLGGASIVLGLLAVGAALRLEIPRADQVLVGYLLAVKLVLLPGAAWLAGRAVGLDALGLGIAVLFAALPTASSAYILAVRMGGDARLVAALVSLGVLASLATLPAWIAALGRTGPL